MSLRDQNVQRHLNRRDVLRLAAVGGAGLAAPGLLPAGATSPRSLRAGQCAVEQFTVDMTSDAATLDPGTQYDTSSYSVYGNIYDTLLARDPETGEIAPHLATSFQVVDPTTWEFKLRDGITFHNGEPFNADAVKFSLERILSPELQSPQRANYALIDRVEVVDPATARVITTEPFPALSAYLTTHRVVPPQYTQERGAEYLASNPVGTGPYTFVEWARGDHITLEANPAYWNGVPPVTRVIFRAVPEGSTRIADLVAGQSDLIFGVNPDDIPRITGQPNLAVLSTATERVAYVSMQTLDTFDSPTANATVREAISHAIDREALLQVLLQGRGEIINQLLSPQHFGYDPSIEPYVYDLDRARALMEEAGYGAGLQLKFLTSPTYSIGNLVVQALQEQLGQIGIEVEIESLEWSLYLKKIQSKDWQDIRFGQWSCSCLDADGVLYPLFHSSSGWSGYSDADVDTALQVGKATIDPAKRQEAYSQALRRLRETTPILPLWQVEAAYGAKNSLTWQPTIDEQFYIMDMTFGDC